MKPSSNVLSSTENLALKLTFLVLLQTFSFGGLILPSSQKMVLVNIYYINLSLELKRSHIFLKREEKQAALHWLLHS